jgi:type II secretory ATPase GspE/PulE/Tfp pilus assembly ATPase PilB-like protein
MSEGMTSMLDDGLEKTKQGLTTFSEVLRVTKVESL